MKRLATLAAALATLAFVAPLAAHHSMGMFDVATPLWVKGTVLRYQPISPHAMIELEATNAETWVEFLNADPLARDLWCGGRDAYRAQFVTLPADTFVDQVSKLIDNPCE